MSATVGDEYDQLMEEKLQARADYVQGLQKDLALAKKQKKTLAHRIDDEKTNLTRESFMGTLKTIMEPDMAQERKRLEAWETQLKETVAKISEIEAELQDAQALK